MSALHITNKTKKRRSTSKSRSLLSNIQVFVLALVLLGIAYILLKLVISWHNQIWLQGMRITVVVAGQNPTVYSYNPQNGVLTQIIIPQNTQVTAAGSYGNLFVSNLWEIGEQEGKGGELLRLSVERELELPVDAYFGPQAQDIFQNKHFGALALFFDLAKLGSIKSNLTVFDKLRLVFSAETAGTFNRRTIDLEKTGAIKKTEFPDGVTGFTVIPEKSQVALTSLRDDLVFQESKTLSIINTTPEQGLAAKVGKILNQLGARVRSIEGNEENVQRLCLLQGDKTNLESLSAKRIVKLFGCSIQEKTPNQPVNLELILGKKFSEYF